MDWIYVALLGAAGAAIPELLRVIASIKKKEKIAGGEWLASILLVLLGAGGVLLLGSGLDNPLQTAVSGAAFPQLFSGLVAAAGSKPAPAPNGTLAAPATAPRRTVWQYIGWDL